MSGNHNKQKGLISKTRLIVYLSIAAFLAALSVFVRLYDVYVYTSLVAKIWFAALVIVYCSMMILCYLLFPMIVVALVWTVSLGVKALVGKK